jgi:transcriptional regulator with GAF, ATPase, and Fis domain
MQAVELAAWIHSVSPAARDLAGEIQSCLASKGVVVQRLDQAPAQTPGVLVFCDTQLEASQLELLQAVSRGRRVIAVRLAAAASGASAWSLLWAGASDVLTWHLPDAVAQLIARLERWATIDRLLKSSEVASMLAGNSPSWNRLLAQVVEVARFTDDAVLLMGESGTGKELLARLIHGLDEQRRAHQLTLVDCSTIVPELSGSEFFGHERGAFTGAVAPRDGAFALADGGSLFLDEIGELPLALQAQLLRAIQERQYRRVGGNSWQHSDFRLVCATNRDLPAEIQRGKFRADLFYRIATWTFRLPPLRERLDDIPLLVNHMLAQLQSTDAIPQLDEAVQDYLINRDYPGNIRELRQILLRIVRRHVGYGPITIGDIPEEDRPPNIEVLDRGDTALDQAIRCALACGVSLKDIRQRTADAAIRVALEDSQGNLHRAALRLGVTDRALQLHRANRRPHEPEGG